MELNYYYYYYYCCCCFNDNSVLYFFIITVNIINIIIHLNITIVIILDRLCGLEIRVPDSRSKVPDFDSRRYQIFRVAVGLERGLLSLVRIKEELLERKVAASV
jgi:hypothetical protein